MAGDAFVPSIPLPAIASGFGLNEMYGLDFFQDKWAAVLAS